MCILHVSRLREPASILKPGSVRKAVRVSISWSIRARISTVSISKSTGTAAGTPTQEGRGNTACEARAVQSWSSSNTGNDAATGAFDAWRTFACSTGGSNGSRCVGKVSTVGAGSDGVADCVADDEVVTVLIGGEDYELSACSEVNGDVPAKDPTWLVGEVESAGLSLSVGAHAG